MNKVRITYYGWDYKGTQRFRTERVIEGEIIKESEKQIVIIEPLGTSATINKCKIISIKELENA